MSPILPYITIIMREKKQFGNWKHILQSTESSGNIKQLQRKCLEANRETGHKLMVLINIQLEGVEQKNTFDYIGGRGEGYPIKKMT